MPEGIPGQCPVCGLDLTVKAVITCTGCRTHYHQDCFQYNGEKCAIFGCEKNPSSKSAPASEWFCEDCHSSNSADADRCGVCKEPRKRSTQGEQNTTKCLACGTANESGVEYCVDCHASLR